MWFRNTKPPPALTEELVRRVWDVNGRLEQLEDRLEGKLEELSRRYRRAEQSEKRNDDKSSNPCADDPGFNFGADARAARTAITSLKSRQGSR